MVMALGRLRAFFWRFHILPLADRLFADAAGSYILKRPFCGFELYVDVSRSNAQRLLYLEGERFVHERALLRRLLTAGMRVADVGANIGYYLLLVESVIGPSGTVTCFEPEPDNLAELRRNVEANRLQNVRIFPTAVGNANGTVSLHSGINSGVATDESGDLTVPIRRLDDVMTSPVDFLKVDVEGYEGHVLLGAKRILRDDRPKLFVEIHPDLLVSPHTVEEILGLLTELYPCVHLFEIAPQRKSLEKLKARYLGGAVRPIPNREILLSDCREQQRKDPFWAVCSL